MWVLSSWQPGDELRLIPDGDVYLLRNVVQGTEVPVMPSNYSSFGNVSLSCPAHRIVTTEIEGDHYFVTLSDGSKWKVEQLDLGTQHLYSHFDSEANQWVFDEVECKLEAGVFLDVNQSDCEGNTYRFCLKQATGACYAQPVTIVAELVS